MSEDLLPALAALESHYAARLQALDRKMGGVQTELSLLQKEFERHKADSDQTQIELASVRALKAKILAPTHEVAE